MRDLARSESIFDKHWLINSRLFLTFSTPASLLTRILSLKYQNIISCLVVRTKELPTHNRLPDMKSKILLNCSKGKCGNSFGEFSNTCHIWIFKNVMMHMKRSEINSGVSACQ